MLGDGVLESIVLVFIWIVTIDSKSHLFTASVLLMVETRNLIAFVCALVSFLIQLCFFCSVIPIAGLDLFNYHVISVVILHKYLRK